MYILKIVRAFIVEFIYHSINNTFTIYGINPFKSICVIQELMDILTDLRPDVDFETETALIDDHILESFDIVSLVAALNDAFDIEIGAKDLVPENFNSAKRLLAMVQRLQDED